MLLKHILGKVEILKPFEIRISDSIEIDFSRMDNIGNVDLDSVSMYAAGQLIFSKKAMTVVYNPLPYYATDEIKLTFVDSNKNPFDFFIPIIILDPIPIRKSVDITNSANGSNTTDSNGTTNSGATNNSNITTDNSSNNSDTTNGSGTTNANGTNSDSTTDGITNSNSTSNSDTTTNTNTNTGSTTSIKPKMPSGTPPFMQVIYDVYPTFDVTPDTFWEKIIHNYKQAIWTESTKTYKAAWHVKNFGFEAITITRAGDQLKVEFNQKLLDEVESLFPKSTKL